MTSQSSNVDWVETGIDLLKLALGRPARASSAVDWDALFSMAVEERCAALIWSRSGAIIRETAPRSVADLWRTMAIQSDAYGGRQLRVLGELVTALRAAGIRPVVLKGLPLAWRLYGDTSVRAAADIDIFVPLAERNQAEHTLLQAAWESVEGAAPWTRTLSRGAGTERLYLEVHSSLVDLNLAHLRLPEPQAHEVLLGGVHLPVHQDDLLPAYLAAHAAKHMPVSLLYDVDFHTLWGSLPLQERIAAFRAADVVGLTGYLAWMNRRSEAVEAGAAGDRSAFARLGIQSDGRSDRHAVFRDVALAPSPFAAALAVAAWVWPPPLRRAPMAFARRCVQRIRGPLSRYTRMHRAYERGSWTRT